MSGLASRSEKQVFAGPPRAESKDVKKKIVKIAKGLIKKSKRQRIKRVRLEAALAEQLSCSDGKASRRLQKCVDAGRLVISDKWVTLK